MSNNCIRQQVCTGQWDTHLRRAGLIASAVCQLHSGIHGSSPRSHFFAQSRFAV